jgi:hypothetical protein
MLNENSTAEIGLYIGTIQALGSYIYSKNIVNSNDIIIAKAIVLLSLIKSYHN